MMDAGKMCERRFDLFTGEHGRYMRRTFGSLNPLDESNPISAQYFPVEKE